MKTIWDKFWKLTVIETRPKMSWNRKRIQVDLQCECWKIRTMYSNNIRTSGATSCWCDKESPELNIGKKFNKLVIKKLFKRLNNSWRNELFATCKCECWTIKDIRYDRIIWWGTKSCGCIELRRKTDWLSNTRPYRIRRDMMNSIYKEEDERYKRRGAKGIQIIEERRYFTWWWNDNKQYYNENSYFTRKNPFKNFDKENCIRHIAYNVSRFDLFDKCNNEDKESTIHSTSYTILM